MIYSVILVLDLQPHIPYINTLVQTNAKIKWFATLRLGLQVYAFVKQFVY